jgi:hypothetical protein
MKLNTAIFHDFFYDDINDASRKRRAKSATHYNGDHFFSYQTTIGFLHRDTERMPVLFISENTFSNTTAGHISALRQASPFQVIEVPFEYVDDYTDIIGRNTPELNARLIIELEDRFCAYFAEVDAQHIKYAARRREFIRKYENFAEFLKVTAPYKVPSPDLIATYENAVELDDARSGQRAAILERQKQAALERLKRYADLPLSAVIGMAYADAAADNIEKRDAIRYLKTIYPGHSFVWIDGEYCQTSQGVTVPRETAAKLYKLYAAGRVKVGMHLDCYTILNLDENFVQIGCHKIPVANIQAIAANL